MLINMKNSLIVPIIIVAVAVSVLFLLFTKKDSNLDNYKIEDKTLENNLTEINQENMSENNELKIEVVQEGNGAEAVNGKIVSVHYTGKLTDGSVFDSSVQRGTPFEFTLGVGMVIKGWDQGVLGMKVGEKRVLTIPSDLAYGDAGIGSIPGGATLIFDVELLGVNE